MYCSTMQVLMYTVACTSMTSSSLTWQSRMGQLYSIIGHCLKWHNITGWLGFLAVHLLEQLYSRLRVLLRKSPTKDCFLNTRRFGNLLLPSPLMKAAASCRNVWYFKKNLWLVISAREPWVMQPSRTSFFNYIVDSITEEWFWEDITCSQYIAL